VNDHGQPGVGSEEPAEQSGPRDVRCGDLHDGDVGCEQLDRRDGLLYRGHSSHEVAVVLEFLRYQETLVLVWLEDEDMGHELPTFLYRLTDSSPRSER